jgi:C1A family cysteine protease
MKYKFVSGWQPDPRDSRDKLYDRVVATKQIPQDVDLREFCSPIENQKTLGSCTAQATVAALEFLLLKENKPYIDLSRLFTYYETRVRIDTVNEDSGGFLRDAIKVVNKIGVCKEELWPYQIMRFTEKPTEDCYKDAQERKIVTYQRLTSIDEMHDCLQQGYPFVFGFTVFSGFESNVMVRTGELHMPKPCAKQIGGHAVLCVGFDTKSNRFLIRNSYGQEWGKSGYFTMPEEYIKKHARDFWVVYR